MVCGDSEGCLLIFNWGLWGDITDRYPGHPQSIDSLIQTSDSVVCTGCMDGAIRSALNESVHSFVSLYVIADSDQHNLL